jgi:sialic acid synthase SpsE/mannose-6-phosphate isomerase-like protein (cupin superfamily)
MHKIPDNLFVLELANNHMGDVSHGLSVIREFGNVTRQFPEFSFAVKLQYRNLDTFIHPALQNREDIKYIKRFKETRLTRADFDRLIDEIRANGFLVMSTPFDEDSVAIIEEQKLDFIKIASCSFTDWPLLERIAATDRPIIASTAGATVEDIDRVVSFLQHRDKDFAILHCVGEYPTADEKMHVSQIDFLKSRYPGVRIGFSTHENPANADIIKLAIAKGAQVFEKHVGIQTDTYPLNAYSADPLQVKTWLEAARYAKALCGVGSARLPHNETELASLRSLRRGIFARHDIRMGETVKREDVYFAFPPEDGQFTANDWSKYANFTPTVDIPKDASLTQANTLRTDGRALVWEAAKRVKALLSESNITIPGGADLEISHHYGLERFNEVGLTMITVVNRGYCKKLLVSLPGQAHPEQFHKNKEETFHIVHGEVDISLNGCTENYKKGDVINVEPGVRHAWVSRTGAIIEEISSTHHQHDSYYTDESINKKQNRKTLLTYWMD